MHLMSATEGEARTWAGSAVIWTASVLSAAAVIALTVYGLGATRRAAAQVSALAAQQCAHAGQYLVSCKKYLVAADLSDDQLSSEEDSYANDELGNLAAARSDLIQQVATEKFFDTELAQMGFPAAITPIVQGLIQANEDRFRVTELQAQSKTLAQLQSRDRLRKAGDSSVETQARLLRKALGLPPPSAS